MKRDTPKTREFIERGRVSSAESLQRSRRKGVMRRTVFCPDCGTEREVYSDTDELRCRSCTSELRRQGYELTCRCCGDPFYVNALQVEQRNRQYCSDGCRLAAGIHPGDPDKLRARDDAMSVARTGTGNPNYKHGKRAGRRHFRRYGRFHLRNKNEEGCRNCDRFAEHLHHIVPRSKSAAGRAELRNGMPLCFECHRGWHDRRVTIPLWRLKPDELLLAVELAGAVWVERNYPPLTPPEEIELVHAQGGVEGAWQEMTCHLGPEYAAVLREPREIGETVNAYLERRALLETT